MPDDYNDYDDEKISINLYRLFPEAAKRVRILEDLKKSWASVVGMALARHSMPYNLGVNEISVSADGQKTAVMLRNMKGNIIRFLTSHYNYNCGSEFNVKITIGVPAPRKISEPEQNSGKRAPEIKEIKIDEETVKKYMSGAPENLPEDINYAVSHLMAFFEKRFNAYSSSHANKKKLF